MSEYGSIASSIRSKGTVADAVEVAKAAISRGKYILNVVQESTSNLTPSEARKLKTRIIDPVSYIGSAFTNASTVFSLMVKHDAYICKAQAVSYFRRVGRAYDAPWTFYCPAPSFDEFCNHMRGAIMSDSEVTAKTPSGDPILAMSHPLRGCSVDGVVIVVSCTDHPVAYCLDSRESFFQACLGPVCAIDFWYNNHSGKPVSCNFEDNGSMTDDSRLPISSRRTSISSVSRATMDGMGDTVRVVHGLSDPNVVVVKYNVSRYMDREDYMKRMKFLEGMVYAISRKRTRWMGSTAGM